MHKIVWTGNRKRMEKKRYVKQPPLASYFANPDEHWALAHIIIKEPRRTSSSIAANARHARAGPSTAASPEFATSFRPRRPFGAPESPAWRSSIGRFRRRCGGSVCDSIPLASSDEVEGAYISFHFSPAKADLLWKPYLYPEPGHDFFLLAIPQGAEHCAIRVRFSKSGKIATLADSTATVTTPLDGVSWVSGRHGKSQ